MGYGDVKVFNLELKIFIFNIDKLVVFGMMFIDVYVLVFFCVLFRYGLFMGRYLFRVKYFNWKMELFIEEN